MLEIVGDLEMMEIYQPNNQRNAKQTFEEYLAWLFPSPLEFNKP